MKRRNFIKTGSTALIAGCLPVSMVQLAFAGKQEDFSFAYIATGFYIIVSNLF